jgi:Antitoxin FitA-like, ribbon-helix-helix
VSTIVRTQVYLPAETHRRLRREARQVGISMTELVRRVLAAHVQGRRGVESVSKEAVLSFIALGRSGESKGSAEHDRILDDALGGDALR